MGIRCFRCGIKDDYTIKYVCEKCSNALCYDCDFWNKSIKFYSTDDCDLVCEDCYEEEQE